MQIPPIWPRENSFVNKLTRHYLHRHPTPATSQTLCCSVSAFWESLANFDGLLQKRKGWRGFSWRVRHCDSSPHYPSTASVQWCSLININTNSLSQEPLIEGDLLGKHFAHYCFHWPDFIFHISFFLYTAWIKIMNKSGVKLQIFIVQEPPEIKNVLWLIFHVCMLIYFKTLYKSNCNIYSHKYWWLILWSLNDR